MNKKIAICDDEKEIADRLTQMVRNHIKSLKTKETITVDTYYSAFALEDSIDNGNTYDLIFMDIILKNENGIQLSNQILKKFNHIKIVFITGHVTYVEDIFAIDPFALLMKPLKEEKVAHIIDKALEVIKEEDRKYIKLKTRDGVFKIDINHLTYVESDKKYLNFTDAEGNQYQTIMTMEEAEKLIGDTLMRCHRCYFINLGQVERICDKTAMFADGKKVPISRNYYKEVYHRFMDMLDKYWEG